MQQTKQQILQAMIDNIRDNLAGTAFALRAAQDTQNAKWEAETKAEATRLAGVLLSYEKQLSEI